MTRHKHFARNLICSITVVSSVVINSALCRADVPSPVLPIEPESNTGMIVAGVGAVIAALVAGAIWFKGRKSND